MAAGQQTAGPGRPRDPRVEPAILAAAVEVLLERGVDRTSIEEVARRAGVTKVTVYRRWPGKTELLAAAVEAVRDTLPTPSDPEVLDAPLPDVIDQLLPRWAETLCQPRWRLLAARLMAAGPDHPELLEAYRRAHVEPRRTRARALLARARAAGHLRGEADLDVVVDALEGAVLYRMMVLHPSTRDPRLLERYLRELLAQVGFTLAPPTPG